VAKTPHAGAPVLSDGLGDAHRSPSEKIAVDRCEKQASQERREGS
jgi:hypothetical protein